MSSIPEAARLSLDVLARQYVAVRAEIVAIEKRIHAWHRSSEESRRLEEIPGERRALSIVDR
jgi:transposase